MDESKGFTDHAHVICSTNQLRPGLGRERQKNRLVKAFRDLKLATS